MLDKTDLTREAALLIRPLPWAMATDHAPIRFGGLPRLPDTLDWPSRNGKSHCHFFAEIDLALLPRDEAMPDVPAQGTVFIFLPLANDGLYSMQNADVLYTPKDVTDVPGSLPPKDLPDLRESDPCHVHVDGITHDGRALIPQIAEALPFTSARAVNQLAVNMLESETFDAAPWRDVHTKHQEALEHAIRTARPLPRDPAFGEIPDGFERVKEKVVKDIRNYRWAFEGHQLDWEFIWDYSKEFYRLCYAMMLDHLREMQDAGVQPRMVDRMIKRMQAKRDDHNRQTFGTGKKPIFFSFDKPVAVSETFDWQTQRWMHLSRFQTGYPPEETVDAFCAMLDEIVQNYGETDADGYNIGPRIGLIDNKIKGHDRHAGNTLVIAKKAFECAVDRAVARHKTRFEALDQAARWDSRVIQAGSPHYKPGFSMGIMPLQMFGLGFELQSAVSCHHDDILLFQIGDSFGLPLERIGPDMVIQLWIKPDDLAAGRFDRVEMTMDMT